MTDKKLIATAREKFSPGTRVSLKETDTNGGLIGDPIECEVLEVLFEGETPMSPTMLVHLGNTKEITLVAIDQEDIGGKDVIALIGVSASDAVTDYGYITQKLSSNGAG